MQVPGRPEQTVGQRGVVEGGVEVTIG